MSDGCTFTLWKDCLTRGGGPELTGKLVQLLLKQKQLRGSTGVIVLDHQSISFYRNGDAAPSVHRPLSYHRGR